MSAHLEQERPPVRAALGSTMKQLVSKGLPVVVATGLVLGSVPVRADSSAGVMVGYGYLQQTRLGAESKGHLFSIGIHTGSEILEEGMFGAISLDFAVDHVFKDLSALGMTFEYGYAFGTRFFGGYVGGALRTGLDGYSGQDTVDNANSSWAPFDPGAMVGIVALLGSYGIGAELRGWLGMNFYESGDTAFEPYFDARLYMSLLF
jgi:hypothetical protein